MLPLQGQQCEDGYHQPQPQHEVVAAVTKALSRKRPTSPSQVGQHEELPLYHAVDVEAELPPYESVSAETFLVNLEPTSECTRCKMTHLCFEHGLCRSMAQCSTFAPNNDFILFPLDDEGSSEPESSIISCFSDDLSCTGSTVTSSCHSSSRSFMASQQVSKDLSQEPRHHDSSQAEDEPNSLVTEWLSKINRAIDCAYPDDRSPDHEFIPIRREPDVSAGSRAVGKAG